MKPGVFTVLALKLVVSTFAVSQSVTTGPITTMGQCGVVVVGSTTPVNIICDQKGLSPAEAKKQAEEYAKILTFIRQNGLKTTEVLQKLDSMAKDISDIKAATVGRHLSANQKTALAAAMHPFAGTVVQLEAQNGDPEALSYVEDFLLVFKAEHIDVLNGGTYSEVSRNPRQSGIILYINPSVTRENEMPVQCRVLFRNLLGFTLPEFHIDHLDYLRRVDEGSCVLTVFSGK